MNNTFCEPGNHNYGLWNIKNNKGIRTCNNCANTEEFPLTNTIKEQIKKQEEATKVLNIFLTISNEDPNILNFTDLLLDDYINYLSKEQIQLFNQKIDEIKCSSLIDINNATLLTALQTTYSNNIDDYYDTLDKFQLYNNDNLYKTIEKENGYSK